RRVLFRSDAVPQQFLEVLLPNVEQLGDLATDRLVLIAHFEGEIAERTSADRPAFVATLLQIVFDLTDQEPQALTGRTATFANLTLPTAKALAVVVDRGEHELLLAREEVIEAALLETGVGAQVRDAERGVASLVQHSRCTREQAFSGVAAPSHLDRTVNYAASAPEFKHQKTFHG